jgi:citronellol/citronellal dehydrogenase
MADLAGKTLFITGASRGIGKAIGERAARDGANVVLFAKTTEPHPKLPGTLYTAAEDIERAGGKALVCVGDVREEAQVAAAVEQAVATFGGIDILINNASAISLTGTESTDMKKFDLMHQINTRGTFMTSRLCLPHLKKAANPHVLNLAPPLNMSPMWFGRHVAYTMAKYGMSLCVLGMAEEYRGKVAFNALWPKTVINTAAVRNQLGGIAEVSHGPAAGHHGGCRPRHPVPGCAAAAAGSSLLMNRCCLSEGVSDLSGYRVDPALRDDQLMPDFFL